MSCAYRAAEEDKEFECSSPSKCTFLSEFVRICGSGERCVFDIVVRGDWYTVKILHMVVEAHMILTIWRLTPAGSSVKYHSGFAWNHLLTQFNLLKDKKWEYELSSAR